jgi:hypothetical protein
VTALRPLIAALIATAFLAGCGGGDDKDDGGGSSSSGTSTESTSSGSIADKSPQEILTASEQALSKVKSFHMEGIGVDKKTGEQKLSGDISLPGKLQVEIATKDGKLQLLLVDKQVFIQADESYWKSQGLPDQALDALVDKWIVAPDAVKKDTAQFEAYADPAKVGKCLLSQDVGKLSEEVAETTLDGQKAVVIEDLGGKPGTGPGKLTVAAEGEPLPLRAQKTGPSEPGAKPNTECGETSEDPDDTIRSDVRLSKYDEPVTIETPKDPVDLDKLQQQLSGETSES